MTNKSKVMYIILLCSTYGYLYISISSVVPMVPLYKYKLYSTYEYLCTSINSVVPTSTSVVRVTPMGDLNKYKSAIGTSIRSVTPTGDLNKYKSAISTSMCISFLYEFMKISDIFYCISVPVICLL